MTDPPPGIRPLNFDEGVFVEAYKEAVSQALESSDAACGTIVTACFSILTAYGAALALITPKDAQADLVVLSPFALLGLGAVAGLIGKASGISLETVKEVEEAKSEIKAAVRAKRLWAYISVGLAFLGVGAAGYVIFASYG
ncbi:membrane hypothetical protein [metagenome]|uniref:Uncharacterized protein n=1 Tax=metagenome TaxID=256318 RepID=A0A2P2CAZ4_9ZZZZ